MPKDVVANTERSSIVLGGVGDSSEIITRRDGTGLISRRINLPVWPNRVDLAARRFSSRSPVFASWIVFVLVPTLVCAIYVFLIASNSYTSGFRATVRSSEMRQAGVTALLGLAGPTQSTNDANAVVQYLQSRDALEAINTKTDLRTQFSAGSVDWLSRLKSSNSIEGFLRYWQRHLEAYFEPTTGTIIVNVSAFSPQSAFAIASASLSLSEKLVNDMSARVLSDGVGFAEKKVAEAEARLKASNQRLRIVQDKERLLDPQKSAASALALSAKLKEQQAQLGAELSVHRAYMAPDSPTVKVEEAQVDALKQEIGKIEALTTAGKDGGDKPYSEVFGTFDEAEAEHGFAEKNYQSALAALEAARMEASRQQIYLATIVKPQLPQEATFPKPFVNTLIVLCIASLLWGIGLLGVFAIREHM